MKTIVKFFFMLLLTISAGQLFAQNKPQPDKNSEDITIRKKGSSNEKLTIVIDGDKVTVNGKPVDEYKSNNVDIVRGDDWGMAAIAPAPPDGGWKMMHDDFLREIRSNHAFLGVMTKASDEGAKITEVTEESAAEKAGLKEGDVITKVNDDKIKNSDDLYKAIGKYKPNEKVNVTYKRDGKENTVSIALGENKQVRAFTWRGGDDNFKFTTPGEFPRNFYWSDKPRLGLQVQDTEDGKGVKVLEVDGDEPAGTAGLEEDDIITQVNGKNITSVDDLKEIMKSAKKGDTLKVTYLRDGKSQSADVKFPKDLKTTDL